MSTSDAGSNESVEIDDALPVPTAPPARFRNARRCLGIFTQTGDIHDLRLALKHYISTGYGGNRLMSRRLGATAPTAGRLNSILTSGTRLDGAALLDAELVGGTNIENVMDAIVEAVRPGNGTQDAESSRSAIRESLVDLLARFPGADLLFLTDSQREFVIERYVALDVFGRFCLDLRATIMDKAADASTGLRRIKQVREYINEQVSAAFKRLRENGGAATSRTVERLTKEALGETFGVFEEYLT